MIYNKITPETLIYKILEENEAQIRYIVRYFKYIEVNCEYDNSNTAVLSHNIYHNEDAVCSGTNIERSNIVPAYNITFDEYYNNICSLNATITNSENELNNRIQSTIISKNEGNPNDNNIISFINLINELITKFVNNEVDHVYISLGLNFKNDNKLKDAIIRQLRISVLNYFNELDKPEESKNQTKLVNDLKENSLPIYNDNIIYSHILYNILCDMILDEFTKKEFSKENNENNIND